MKKSKKILAVVFAIAMLLTSIPMSAINADTSFATKSSALETSGKCGDNVFWSFNETTKTLTISGTGAMGNFIKSVDGMEEIDLPYGHLDTEKVVIKNGVTSISDYAFSSIGSNINSVEIADSVVSIGNHAFEFTCLKTVTIPQSVVKIGDSPFGNCYELTKITVDKNNKYYCSDDRGALFDKNKTVLIQYPLGNKNSSYTIPNGVTVIEEWVFAEFENLTEVVLPKTLKTVKDYAFRNCTGLKSLSLPEGLESIGHQSFMDCYNIKNIVFPKSMKNIGTSAFWYCTGLTSVTIPNKDTVIGESAFSNCPLLEITCQKDSLADKYAKSYKIPVKYIAVEESLGDLTGDGVINSSDALMVLQFAVQQIKLTDSQIALADVNKDSKVNSTDALRILQYVVKQIDHF